ncbi:MAG: hypothetical protein HYS41_06155 [Candidatus Omnitrophica bacterium]|nr:hypothetical protein [Candidatus Omnitrophota bacterium]
MTPPLLGACAVYRRMKKSGSKTAPVLAYGQHSNKALALLVFQGVVG